MSSAPRLVGPHGHNRFQVQSSVHAPKIEEFISSLVGFGQNSDASTRGRQKLDPHRAQSSFPLPRALFLIFPAFGKKNVIDVPCMVRPAWWLIHVARVIIDKRRLSCFTSEDFIQRQIQLHPRWLPSIPTSAWHRKCVLFPPGAGHKAGCCDVEPGLAVIRVTQAFSELLQLEKHSFTSPDLLHSCQTEQKPWD